MLKAAHALPHRAGPVGRGRGPAGPIPPCVAAIVIAVRQKHEPDATKRWKNWHVVWLLGWLGLFFIHVWVISVRAAVNLVGPGAKLKALRALSGIRAGPAVCPVADPGTAATAVAAGPRRGSGSGPACCFPSRGWAWGSPDS